MKLQLITIWSNGKRALASGYRRVFLMSTGTKWYHLFEAHTNTYMRMRKIDYEHLLVKEEILNKKYWANYCMSRLNINQHYRDIFEFTAGEEEMSLAVMNETLVVLKEIRDLLAKNNNHMPMIGATNTEPHVISDTPSNTSGKQHMDFWEKQKQKPPVTIFEETPQNEVEKLKPKRRGRPKGSKGKKK